ncbi:hypothetical protein K488DRAFT_81465 [Vararia minispora EC-137]|uniref:Uncharacterized protein n=1 Tax=Vararia minispora EC-137 TaxID=1314806 RepID=A0ACB8QZG2_9AGAM|nr:hypothetical protein K488DRAFT_81465 [Vararia minispora EC-137]
MPDLAIKMVSDAARPGTEHADAAGTLLTPHRTDATGKGQARTRHSEERIDSAAPAFRTKRPRFAKRFVRGPFHARHIITLAPDAGRPSTHPLPTPTRKPHPPTPHMSPFSLFRIGFARTDAAGDTSTAQAVARLREQHALLTAALRAVAAAFRALAASVRRASERRRAYLWSDAERAIAG